MYDSALKTFVVGIPLTLLHNGVEKPLPVNNELYFRINKTIAFI